MKLANKLTSIFYSSELDISDELVEYYKENPDDLDLIVDKEHFNSSFLGFFFILGLIITIGARIVQYFFGDFCGDFINNVILDVLSEVGIAIFGGAIVAYLIGYLKENQYEQNMRFRSEIKDRLEEQEAKKNKL